MPSQYFTSKKLNDHLTIIKTITGEDLYYLQGQEKGLLIDTSEGMSPLKPLIDSLAKTDYDIILTHGHIDHAMGAAEFLSGHKVYMNLADRVVYDGMSDTKQRTEYAKMSIPKDVNFDDLDIKPVDAVHADDHFKELVDGRVFDLGNLHVKAFHFPGHTPGMTALLLQEDRILLTGDGANRSTFVWDNFAPSLHSYRASLVELQQRTKGLYDHVFISHGDHEVSVNLLQNLIDLCDEIFAGKVDNMPFEFMGKKALIAKKIDFSTPGNPKRVDGGDGNIFYNPDNL